MAIDMDAIRARYGYWYDSDDDIERGADGETLSHCIVREDVPALLAEVERLRENVARWRHAYEMAEPLLTDRDRLAATVERVRKAVESHIGAPCGCNAIAYQVRAAIEGTDS